MQIFKRAEHAPRIAAGRDRKAGGDQRVLDLERADQRQHQRDVAPFVAKLDALREAVDARVDAA